MSWKWLLKRLKNKAFVITLIAQIILIAKLVGIDLMNLIPHLNNYVEIVDAIYVIASLFGVGGVLLNPTTEGITD